MDALDILEKRIDCLSRIIGSNHDAASDDTSTDVEKSSKPTVSTATETIVDSLISANILLNGAVGGRESVAKAVGRVDELEQYLDPNYLDEQQHVRSKEVYLNAIAPDLHAQLEQLVQIKKLEPTLGAEYFRNIPGERTDVLKQMAQENIEFEKQSELIGDSLILALKRYGEIQAGLMNSLSTVNKRLEAIEEKLQAKKRAELEKELSVDEDCNKT